MQIVIKAIRFVSIAFMGFVVTCQVSWAQKIEQVVVTAERRETNLQDTPIAISALSADTIQQTAVSNMRELATFVPNLDIRPYFAYGNSTPNITIRGIGGSQFPQFGIATDTPVGIYIDGIYYSRNPGSLLSLAEIERVEVLRGPQGTLFGRNTTAGAIAYYTYKASTDGFEGYVDLTGGSYNEVDLKAAVNLPLTDQWAMRIAYGDLNRDGTIKRGDIDYNNVDDRVEHVTFHGEPTDQMTIDVSLSHTSSHSNGEAQDFAYFDIEPGGAVGAEMLSLSVALQAQGEPPIVANDPRIILGTGRLPHYCIMDDGNPYTWGKLCDLYNDTNMTVASAKVTYDVNDHITFSSLTGYLTGAGRQMLDPTLLGTRARPFSQDFKSYQQEFQINYAYPRWNAVVGLNYYNEKGGEEEITYETGIRGGKPFADEVARVLSGQLISRRHETYGQTTQAIALFGQGTYRATQKLDVTVGLRYTQDTKEGWIRYFAIPVYDDRSAFVLGENGWDATDWRLSFQYHVNDNVMVYVSGAKAHKAGIMNDGSVEQTISNDPRTAALGWTNPEDVVSTELGLRSEWFDHRCQWPTILTR